MRVSVTPLEPHPNDPAPPATAPLAEANRL
jgi:hypothetical protein